MNFLHFTFSKNFLPRDPVACFVNHSSAISLTLISFPPSELSELEHGISSNTNSDVDRTDLKENIPHLTIEWTVRVFQKTRPGQTKKWPATFDLRLSPHYFSFLQAILRLLIPMWYGFDFLESCTQCQLWSLPWGPQSLVGLRCSDRVVRAMLNASFIGATELFRLFADIFLLL